MSWRKRQAHAQDLPDRVLAMPGVLREVTQLVGLKKNTAQLVLLFALSNLWMVQGKLMGEEHECAGENRASILQGAKSAQSGKKNEQISWVSCEIP